MALTKICDHCFKEGGEWTGKAVSNILEVVTAGEGNVCLWCLHHLFCKVRVREGLGPDDIITQLALAPPTGGRHHRAFAAFGSTVALVDLTEGRLVEKRRDLHLREITCLVHCPLLDCLVTASRDTSIRVWGPDWDPVIAFVSHTDMGITNDWDTQGRWFYSWCRHNKICTAVGPLSKALNPALLQGRIVSCLV